MVQGAGSSWTSALAADSEKPSDSSHEWRRPNVMASVASSKFCVKSSFGLRGFFKFGVDSHHGFL